MVESSEQMSKDVKTIKKYIKKDVIGGYILSGCIGLIVGSIITAAGLYLDNVIHDNFLRDDFITKIHKRIEIAPFYDEKCEDALFINYYLDDAKTNGGAIGFFKDKTSGTYKPR